MTSTFCKWFSEIGITDVGEVGGKNASLGEMFGKLTAQGIRIPDGYATTADAFRKFLHDNQLEVRLGQLIASLDNVGYSNLNAIAQQAKSLMMQARMPDTVEHDIREMYDALCKRYGRTIDVAVRSSATAEDLPSASFAGQHESFLNVVGADDVVKAVQKCFASLYNARAIKYRIDNGFEHDKVALSAGIQLMVRSDLSSSGVAFTIDPDSGFKDVVIVTGCWGLGENIVQGAVIPDEFHLFKPALNAGKRAIISKKCGSKSMTMVYADEGGLINKDTPDNRRIQWVLSDEEVTTVASWSVLIERHYGMAMDIEWAKDGITNDLFIVQARPETVHGAKDPFLMTEYSMSSKGRVIVEGSAVGTGVASGIARILHSPADAHKLKEGEILVTEITNPDWDPILKKAAAIITDKGGRTSHAAIVAREVGAVAIVGAHDATKLILDGQEITVCTALGKRGLVYDGLHNWVEKQYDFRNQQMPQTAPMMILADPEKAYQYSLYPNQGVGLMRLEFVISNVIQVHPMALVKFDELTDQEARKKIEVLTAQYIDKKKYFVDALAMAVANIAAAFYPKDVIVRMSDFKSNEYANLIGGKQFELDEENPMIGFRGASRYYHERYKEGFRLECEAMKVVRDEMALTNVKLMIPFCRTVEEGKKVVSLMEEYGLKRGDNGLEVYVMAEIPSNVILAEEFAKVFDGFSIGSNDLTQLTLGIDRDSDIIAPLFDENNAAVKWMISRVVKSAHECNVKIGLCGQAPSDDPSFADFLVKLGINSISFNPDALLKGIANMLKAEGAAVQ